jgi:hypothetical protein
MRYPEQVTLRALVRTTTYLYPEPLTRLDEVSRQDALACCHMEVLQLLWMAKLANIMRKVRLLHLLLLDYLISHRVDTSIPRLINMPCLNPSSHSPKILVRGLRLRLREYRG